MVWIITSGDEAEAIQDLKNTSDRAAAIVAAAILETRLEAILRRVLLDHKKNADRTIREEMFRTSGPLGSFSAKINLTFMLGICSAATWTDLDYIREIRNAFAHRVEAQKFETIRIKDLCMNLRSFVKHIFPYGTKAEDATQDINPKMFERDLPAQLADPRKRYILCVTFYIATFSGIPVVDGSQQSPLCRQLC